MRGLNHEEIKLTVRAALSPDDTGSDWVEWVPSTYQNDVPGIEALLYKGRTRESDIIYRIGERMVVVELNDSYKSVLEWARANA